MVDACRNLRGEMNVSPSTRLPAYVVGDAVFMREAAPVLQALAKLKSYLDYGTFQPIQIAATVTTITVTLAIECLLLAATWDTGAVAVFVGGWEAPWGITLVVDRFSALMLVISSAIVLAVLVYASAQGVTDQDQGGPVSIFHPTFLILVAGVSNAFLAGDLFNLYVGFEILLTASYVLLTLGGTTARIRAGVTYTVVSVLSSMLFLTAIGMVYAATGTVNPASCSGWWTSSPKGGSGHEESRIPAVHH